MSQSNREMPPVLRRLNRMEFDYADGEGIDFEPFAEFLSVDDTTSWIRAWTGNEHLDGNDYLVFGQDGSGGYAALWLARKNTPLAAQPVVFFGSEGELGVIARDLSDFLWLLASNLGPYEALTYPEAERIANTALAQFAAAHAASPQRSPSEILSLARDAFPEFESDIQSTIR